MFFKKELKKYLDENPWPDEFTEKIKVEHFFNFNIKLTAHELWPLISDTSEVNRLLGLDKMTLTEVKGKIHAQAKLAFFHHEWEEIPWEWEAGKEIKTARVYSRGIISYVRAHFYLSQTTNNNSHLTIYFGWIPKGRTGYLILKIAEPILRKRYKKIYKELNFTHSKTVPFNIIEGMEKYAISDASDIYKNHEEKLNPIRDSLLNHGFEASLIYRLINYVINSTDDKLYRIKPVLLSEILNAEPDKLISLMIYSCKYGLLNISWDIVCPHCRGVRENHTHLWTIDNRATCDVCSIDFSTSGMNIIETTFTVNPGIRKVEKILYCSAEPSKKPHILLQKTINHGCTYTFQIPEINKRLRFRTKGKKSYGIVDVETGLSTKNLYWDDLNSNTAIKCSPGSTVFINNTDKNNEQYIIEISEEDQYALRPAELFNFHEFREIFSDETLADGISIDIGIQNILFIDIAGSTEYYKIYGDTEAFKTIKKYFVKVNETARIHHGVIVKTIGDAAMLSFANPADALRCAIKLITIFDGSDKDVPLTSRISINRGSCLAVNLNTSIDYFGQTVNIASKLQGFTEAGEITMTEDFIIDPGISSYLKDKNYSFRNTNRAEIEGTGTVLFRKIKIKKLPK